MPQHLSKEEFLALQNPREHKDIVIQKSDMGMGILDVDSLFTNITLGDTINNCTNTLFENTE